MKELTGICKTAIETQMCLGCRQIRRPKLCWNR